MRKLLLPAVVVLAIGAACTKTHLRGRPFSIELTPPGPLYTNATITLLAVSSNGEPSSVEFLKNGTVVASDTAAPFSYDYDSTGDAEGPVTFVARAHHGGVTDSAPLTVVVDRTPPRILSFLPFQGGTNVWTRVDAEAIFSEPMRDTSIFDGGLEVRYGALGDTAGAVVLTNATLHIAASQELLQLRTGKLPFVPGQVSVTFFPTVTDRAGNALSLPATRWNWAVPAWQAPTDLPLPEAGSPIDPQSGIALDANPLAAYALGKHLYVEHWDGNGWQQYPPLEIAANDPILAASMRNLPFGNPVVAWIENDAAIGQDVFARQWNGVSWSPLGADGDISAANGLNCGTVAIGISTSGLPSVAFAQTNGDLDVYSKDWNGTSWSVTGGALFAPAQAGAQSDPAIAIDTQGRAVAAWRDVSSIRAARRSGATWTALGVAIDAGAGAHPSVAAAGGEPVVAWEEAGDVFAKQFDGATWQPLGGAIDAVTATTAKSPHVEIGFDGAPVVAWLESDAAPFVVRVARWDGNAWAPLGPALTVATNQSVTAASLSLDTKGAPHITLTQPGKVFSRRLNGY